MKKCDILKMIEANKTIEKNKELVSISFYEEGIYRWELDEKCWFPNIKDLEEHFTVLKKEVKTAINKTNENRKIIDDYNCQHETRLIDYSAYGNSSVCVLCGKKIPLSGCSNLEYF